MDITGFAFVTGGASGIGRATCLAFAKDGAVGLVVADLNLEGARETAAQAKAAAVHDGFRVDAIQVDVTSEDSVRAAVAHARGFLGRIDYGVHSAGIPAGTFDPIAAASFADFKHLLDVNVNGTFLFTSLVSKAMMDQEPRPARDPARGSSRGSIVILASVSSFMAVPNMVQYTSCKHAILGITKTAALDNAPNNIRVNCVCPTWTDTPMTRRATDVAPGLEEALLATIPMKRLGRPEEAADAVIFLCSPRSSFTTGTGLVLDGGMTLSC
ncbi:hypothetical protein KVR01_004789 [Diaporthe batatas]|uniref:uncharacterized protein n=1 Tax=Diaporthe batatas TaxID=748121 RepID=UPI001D0459DB|nr:uncharacterized protein KVR01_004789 [Diaporthe batatas]KAG8166237.1 hypothetical protein KVR01_004789 [Diaporthe batatas]